jgi:hypothetical protein
LFEEGQQGQKVSTVAQKRKTMRQPRLSKMLQLVSSALHHQKAVRKQIQNRLKQFW